jgi:uncharacterized protein (UPF0147 family)
MKHANTQQWQHALQYLIDADDAPQNAQRAAVDALQALERTTTQHHHETQAAHAALQTLLDMERDLPKSAVRAAHAGKSLDLDKRLRDIEKARATSTLSRERATITQHVQRAMQSLVEGGCLRDHADDLVRWIATRRHAAPYQCGPVDTLPPPVQVIYGLVCPSWYGRWDEALSLNGTTRLPLLYEAQWDADVRASLAWAWEQLALGLVEKVPHPHDRDPARAPRLLIPTQRAVRLPQVPAAVQQRKNYPFAF